ncbi:hypothetical protein RPP02_01380, partial [Staphylococcus aureus]|nr:hypothetical protein [Staphylococcus aureus]
NNRKQEAYNDNVNYKLHDCKKRHYNTSPQNFNSIFMIHLTKQNTMEALHFIKQFYDMFFILNFNV